MRIRVCFLVLLGAMLMAWPWPAAAQVALGDNTKLHAGGSLSFGYSGGFGSTENSSTHGVDVGGTGRLNGSYYNPQFLSFDVEPYYRRSQSNSIFQTISNGSGFTANTRIFSGSQFPASIAYSRTWDETGQFGIPGISGITSHGNGDGLTLSWSALLPKLPTFNATYSLAGGSSEIFGTNSQSEFHNRNLTLQSTYRLRDFDLQAQYIHLTNQADFPSLLNDGAKQSSNTGTDSFNFNAGHRLPWAGFWHGAWTRTGYSADYRTGSTTGSSSGTVNDLNTNVSFNPIRKLNVGGGVDYNDNAYGSLQQQIIAVGGAPLFGLANSRTFSMHGQASYSLFRYLTIFGRASRYQLYSGNVDRSLTQFSGSAVFNFAHRLLGSLSFSVGVTDTANKEGNTGTSLVGNVSFLRQVRGWEVGGDFSYLQQVQTLVATYTTSQYSYGSSVKRRWGGFHWMGSFRGSHSGLTQFEGYNNRHESFSTSLGFGRLRLNGHYSQSNGESILTATGLVPVPVGVPAPLIQSPVFYNGVSYGYGAGFSPLRRLTVSGTFGRARSDTLGIANNTGFQSKIVNARLEYRLRKLNIESNFTRFEQNITTGVLPAVLNAYYVRVSRWFDIF